MFVAPLSYAARALNTHNNWHCGEKKNDFFRSLFFPEPFHGRGAADFLRNFSAPSIHCKELELDMSPKTWLLEGLRARATRSRPHALWSPETNYYARKKCSTTCSRYDSSLLWGAQPTKRYTFFWAPRVHSPLPTVGGLIGSDRCSRCARRSCCGNQKIKF